MREKDGVRGVHHHGRVEQLRPVDASVFHLVLVVGKYVDVEAEEHLRQLQYGDALLDPRRRSPPAGANGVVGVHDGVNDVVDSAEPVATGRCKAVGVPYVGHDGDVVVPVEEG